MLVYTNSYNCVVANNKSEVIITFSQNVPQLDDAGNFIEMKREAVSTVTMTGELAKQLVESINNLLEPKQPKE